MTNQTNINSIKKIRKTILSMLKENVIAFIITGVLSIFFTVILFVITAPPATPSEVKDALIKQTQCAILENQKMKKSELSLENLLCFSEKTDIGLGDTVVLFGKWGKNSKKILPCHYVAVFDPEPEGIIDKIVGRQSFYKISSLTLIYEPNPDLYEITAIETIDIDKDGSKEIHLRLRATWADGVSVTPLIYKRNNVKGWDFISLPSIDKTCENVMEGRNETKYSPLSDPILFFGCSDTKLNKEKEEKYFNSETDSADIQFPYYSYYQDVLNVNHNCKKMKIYLLRNGGDYQLRQHPIKNSFQIAVIAQARDEYSVQSDHYLSVMFFCCSTDTLKLDPLWNWGYPMFTVYPMKTSEVYLDDIAKGGVSAHVVDNSFFGYTEFQRFEMRSYNLKQEKIDSTDTEGSENGIED